MFKQKVIPLLVGATFLFSCGASRIFNVNTYTDRFDSLKSDVISVNKGDKITILIDISKFPVDEEISHYGSSIVFVGNSGEGEFYTIFDDIKSFKYNDEDVTRVYKETDAYNNNYVIFNNDAKFGNSIGLRHDLPNKGDKISIVGYSNGKYENIVVRFFYVKY